MPDQSNSLTSHLHTLEQQLLTPSIRSNPASVATLLADDFREFGSSGRIYTKPEILTTLATEAPHPITLQDFACHRLSPDTALVTYRALSATRESLRSSLWIHRDNRWQMLFHQGTNRPHRPG